MKAYVLPTDGLRMRREPSLDGKIYKTLPYRSVVEVEKIVPDWCKVLNVTLDLWVHGAYLGASDPQSAFVSPVSASRVNMHIGAMGYPPDNDKTKNGVAILTANKVQSVLVPTYQPNWAQVTVEQCRQAGVEHIVLRAVAPWFPKKGAEWAAMAVQSVKPFYNAITAGNKRKPVMMQLHNEPNLYSEGLESWGTGKNYNKWFLEALAVFKREMPSLRIGFSPMSPGGNAPGERTDETAFINACSQAISACDWVAVHCYYVNADASDLNPPVTWWKKFAQKKPILCTESGPALNRFVTVGGAQEMFKKFSKIGVPAFAWLLDGLGNDAFQGQSWTRNNIVLPSFG